MVSSGMLRHVALVRTDVSEELSASFIRMRVTSEKSETEIEKFKVSLVIHKKGLRMRISITPRNWRTTYTGACRHTGRVWKRICLWDFSGMFYCVY
jgi:hypothetical protein